MALISQRISSMPPSETLAMTQIANELAEAGKDVIKLSIGEPDFNTPEVVKEAAKTAIDENWTHYPPVPGYPELKKAICAKFKRDNNLDYTPDQIIVSTGAKQSIYQVVMALVDPGDEVVIPAPYWVSYKAVVQLAEGKSVYIQTTIENDFKVTPDQLRAALTPKTKMMIFSSPSNPTGMLYSREELKALAEVLRDYPNVIVLADEIYEHINFEGKHESMAQFDWMKERTVTVNGVAKGFAMTGWRIGFIGAPVAIAKACNKLQGQVTSATCSIAQRATIKAMQMDPAISDDIINMRNIFLKRRDLVYDLLCQIPGFKVRLPKGAFYFFPDISELYGKQVPADSVFAKTYNKTTIENSTDFCMYILYDANVALVMGAAFGDDRCVRLSYATSEEKLREAMRRIREAVVKMK
ncbi:MAG: pyridoxal phosphate-dependent aminotransferase [Bacteroidales bacterium]|nr:pyridoxal phosphate-dependent aminotransferase [Bacteroidales bacterium]